MTGYDDDGKRVSAVATRCNHERVGPISASPLGIPLDASCVLWST